jgi:uncharacterized hydrophobic protein (TIGR00271 family)
MTSQPFWHRVTRLFRLDGDLDREGTVAAIRNGVAFSGPNVWALVLAIFVASIGLNLNSPAVIIGAMLISPLMGPITGAGLALGIYDLALLRKALANLALMTGISLVVSTLYFWLSPLDQSTAELMARTTPTFYDVFIAALGGAALMVGVSQKSKSTNLLAGVAIATALMPPLCTAGFGLATRDLNVFAGAIYLYLINSVFIGLVTYLFSKALRLRTPGNGEAVDAGKVRKRHVVLTSVAVLVFVTPSLFIAYNVVNESTWRARLTQFEQANLTFSDTQVVSTKVVGAGEKRTLEVALVGSPLSDDLKTHLTQQLDRFGLANLTLKFVQPSFGNQPPVPAATVPTIESLVPEVTKEVTVLFPSLANLAWGDLTTQTPLDSAPRQEPTAFARWLTEPAPAEKERLAAFLRLRLNRPGLSLVHETLTAAPVKSGAN